MSGSQKSPIKIDRRFQILAGSMDMGIVMLARDFDLEYANPQACQLLGCERLEDLKDRWLTLRPLFSGMLEARALRSEAASRFEIEIPSGAVMRRFQCEARLIEDEGAEDVLLLARPQEQIEAWETDLRGAARFHSLTRLFGALVHDLKSPLNTLTINLDLLKTFLTKNAPAEPAIQERLQRYLKVLGEELGRLTHSLQNLVEHTVPPRQPDHECELHGLLLDFIALIVPQARRQQVTVESQLDDRSFPLEGQPDQYRQALIHLAVHALEAMPEGGKLTIGLQTGPDQAILHFTDSGPGLPRDVLDRIWDRHFATKHGGTEIGLYVARSLIESFGGTLKVETRENRGTSFVITFPIARKES